MTIEPQEDEEAGYLSAKYKIFPEALAASGRSLSLLLLHRRCASCWGTLFQEEAGGIGIEANEHMKTIASHCSKQPDFIHPGLPIMEAILRILLSNGNKPTTLEQIYDTLQERRSDPTNPWTPPPAKLYRMISRDAYYGIGEVTPPAGRQAA